MNDIIDCVVKQAYLQRAITVSTALSTQRVTRFRCVNPKAETDCNLFPGIRKTGLCARTLDLTDIAQVHSVSKQKCTQPCALLVQCLCPEISPHKDKVFSKPRRRLAAV